MSVVTIIDQMLAEQQQLTAVERFARQHESGGPAQARYYKALIPLEKPRAGEQYAFGVDLDLCTSCKACVSACHSLNGLDEDEIWRNVGFVHGGSAEEPYQQTITTACHHCLEPGCLEGCPVEAYEKDAATGIVRHLDDQCIGCQYCTLKCPYDVPKYSKKRGIVRKCDMCYHRLAVDEAPACVQACPNAAITIRIISKEATLTATEPGDEMVPGAFDSSYTKPSTSYTTRKSMPANARPANAHRLQLEHAHWPLVWMLVLSQWSAGLFTGGALLAAFAHSIFAESGYWSALAAFALLQVGLMVSVLHLGRPLGAWRFFLGLRRSWMSREILAFSVFAGVAAMFTVAAFWPAIAHFAPAVRMAERWVHPAALVLPLGLTTAFTGLAGILCSAMIYIDTRRPFWSPGSTLPKFFGTTLLLGLASLAATLAWGHDLPFRWLVLAAAGGAAWLQAVEFLTGWLSYRRRESPAHRSALILARLLGGPILARLGLTLAALVLANVAIATAGRAAAFSATAFALLLAASFIIERYCYFAASAAPKMPGGVST
jgi:Fe-S-cluster-containing dehydrogenase component/DMSO reductase anchor subunit